MARYRIVVAEDHEPLLAGIQDILETEGYAVFTATDGAEALRVVERVHPDLIIADIMMPTMDGYALYEAMRSSPEWEDIPVVFLTSKAESADMEKGRELGVEGYITKPFDPHRLLATVRAVLECA